MSRSAETIQREGLSLYWPSDVIAPVPGGVIAAVVEAFAGLLADVEATAEAMVDEFDPRTAVLCLPDFERVLGADPCGRDVSTMNLPARQQFAHQRWTARGGQSIPYFVGLAAKRGVAITIEEVHLSEVDAVEVDFELVEPPEQFIWHVQIPLGSWTDFIVDESGADELLYDFTLADIECDIMRAAPAHTRVVFTYLPGEEG